MSAMEITQLGGNTQAAPAEWFTGEVWLDRIAAAPAPSRLRAYSVHFAPGSRTAWHRHPFGQIIHVTEGIGLAQQRGGPVQMIRAGDTVRFEAGEDHWHGAAPTSFMTHLAMHEAGDDGAEAQWGEKVGDEEYLAAPASQ